LWIKNISIWCLASWTDSNGKRMTLQIADVVFVVIPAATNQKHEVISFSRKVLTFISVIIVE
jgi:hypothetical protein